MIDDLKPYAEYKESGLPWLGRVPGHWDVKRLKSAAKIVMGQSPSSQDCSEKPIGVPFLQGCAEFGAKTPIPKQFCSDAPKRAPADAILLSVRAPVGRLNLADQQYGIGRGLCAVVPHQSLLSTLYARYAIEAGVSGLMTFSTGSTYGAVSVGDVGVQPIPLPPPTEQAAIVRFLDWANGRLERTIRAKRKVIALLNEQKQAIIHRAVTRGLDPSVPLKPSGIPWLGDIPQHWEVLRAKYLFREVDERSRDGTEELLSVSHITGITPRSQKNITMFKAASYAGHKLCRPGDLVVNTMWAWMSALGLSTYTGIISPAYAVYRPRRPEGIVGIYMDGLLRSRPYVSNIICHSTGLRASRLRLYPEEFFRLPIIQPPGEEQRQIVERIHGETSELESAISRLEREIDLLREYRTRLVADVVTGKLDVREAAARLPDEVPLDSVEGDADLTDETEAADEEAG